MRSDPGRRPFPPSHAGRFSNAARLAAFGLALALTLGSCATTVRTQEASRALGAASEYSEPGRTLPHDVASFIDRAAGCEHWSGEGGDNTPERAREIRRAVAHLRCERLPRDEVRLRQKYRDDPRVLRALDDLRILAPGLADSPP